MAIKQFETLKQIMLGIHELRDTLNTQSTGLMKQWNSMDYKRSSDAQYIQGVRNVLAGFQELSESVFAALTHIEKSLKKIGRAIYRQYPQLEKSIPNGIVEAVYFIGDAKKLLVRLRRLDMPVPQLPHKYYELTEETYWCLQKVLDWLMHAQGKISYFQTAS